MAGRPTGAIVSSTTQGKESIMAAAATTTEARTSVAKVVELTAESPESFEDAIRRAVAKASETIEDINAAWVKSQQVSIRDGEVTAYRVDLKVTFVVH